MRDITVAEHAGTCFGVQNAIQIAQEATQRHQGVYILGEIVHNPRVVAELSAMGLIQTESVTSLKPGDHLVIRAHGDVSSVYDYCRRNGINIIDATCPFVRYAQQIAEQLEGDGYQVIIVGEKDHPEVRAISDRARNSLVVSDSSQLGGKRFGSKVGILSQTTQTRENFRKVVASVMEEPEIKVHNTICDATTKRQRAATELCHQVDFMVVVGGHTSANTKRLAEICGEIVPTVLVQDASELERSSFSGKQRVGVTAGASTPEMVIREVVARIQEFAD